MSKKYLYFAYGSNLNMEQMQLRCPKSVPLFKAKLFGAELVFKTYADVIRVGKKRSQSFVNGAVYEITHDCLKSLDIYEGYPKFYKRTKCRVIDSHQNIHEVFMYVMQPDVRDLKLPTNRYFTTVHDGFIDWKINPQSLYSSWEKTYEAINGGIEND